MFVIICNTVEMPAQKFFEWKLQRVDWSPWDDRMAPKIIRSHALWFQHVESEQRSSLKDANPKFDPLKKRIDEEFQILSTDFSYFYVTNALKKTLWSSYWSWRTSIWTFIIIAVRWCYFVIFIFISLFFYLKK